MELGAEVDVHVIDHEESMFAYGVAPVQTPAIVVARHQVKSVKTIPEVNIIKEWLKDAE